MRLIAHSAKALLPPDKLTNAVITPSSKMKTIIKILYVFNSPSDQKETVIAVQRFCNVSIGEKLATNNAAVTIPEPSDKSTLFVVNTITIATIGGKIETQVPIIIYSSNFLIEELKD
jgi:hypothetical protein